MPLGRVMGPLWLAAALLGAMMLLGCALPAAMQTAAVSVWARSHNRSAVDVYLLCGDREARWLGVIGPHETGATLDFPSERTRCVQGLNFFLLDREHNHGYWVGPMYLLRDSRIDLVIEKYAGLSTVNLGRD
jgi:hypothetical protein